MENTLFDLLKKIKKEEFGTIAYFAETDTKETKFKDFEYFEIEKNGLIFYIQNATMNDNINKIYTKFTITPYIKHNFNCKQQFDYPIGFNTFDELVELCKKYIIKKRNTPLANTSKQTIYFELLTYKNTKFGKITLLQYLREIAGYRELKILNNIDYITMNLNNENYLVLEFYSKDGQSFAINTKNINRLIIS